MKFPILFLCAVMVAKSALGLTMVDVGSASAARSILGVGATVGFVKVGAEALSTTKNQVEWFNLNQALDTLEMSLQDIPESADGIYRAASDKDKIDGQLRAAEREADKLKNSGPNEPPRNHWQMEVKAILKRALRMVEKRLKGKMQQEYLARIREIARKVGLDLSKEP